MNPGLSTGDCATYSVLFAQSGAARAGEPAWLRQTRQNAFETFVTLGWPTTKEEAWRFTDPGRITPGLLPLAETDPASGTPTFEELLRELGRGTGHRLRFVDGRHAGERLGDWPAPPGLALAPLATAIPDPAANLDAVLGQALRQPSAFVALNTAFMRDGAVVRIPPGLVVEAPIFLVYLAAAPERDSERYKEVVMERIMRKLIAHYDDLIRALNILKMSANTPPRRSGPASPAPSYTVAPIARPPSSSSTSVPTTAPRSPMR